MYFKKVPSFFSSLFPKALWQVSSDDQIYLTFDDGPHPDSTPYLLNLLDNLEIKAHFFCLGCQAELYPEIIQEIIDKGHVIGHHGYKHISGWTTSYSKYIKNIDQSKPFVDSTLFRPPYGRLSLSQYRHISNLYTIIMWTIMPGDFNKNNSATSILDILKKNTKGGAIITLHDTVSAWEKNKTVVEDYCLHIRSLGMSFGLISDGSSNNIRVKR